MIILTGAAGFIGSCLLAHLKDLGEKNLVIVDDFIGLKNQNLTTKTFYRRIHRAQLFDWLELHKQHIKQVYHLGARTDTTEKNQQIFHTLNLSYSKKIWWFCEREGIPLVYASSAATYGLGTYGFKDAHDICNQLQPLNPYAISKNDFDKWVLQQKNQPPFWAGLKFFNVYGPNEYHKGRMASVVFHAFHQIRQTGEMKLFRSHKADVEDGFQSRDFIYVKDVVRLCHFFMHEQPTSGIYNVGTGKARSFLDLVTTTFSSMDLPPVISFIDTPLDIRDTYQYYTCADMQKTIQAGYTFNFTSLEAGITGYVKEFLLPKKYI